MSEFQYYEFVAVDRPLTKAEMAEVRRLSTRATITNRRFQNVYHWGDFHGDPNAMMAKFYDAMVYHTNWGTRHFMIRVPAAAVDANALLAYANANDWSESDFCVQQAGEFLVLGWFSENDGGGEFIDEWDDERGDDYGDDDSSNFGNLLQDLLPIRDEILAGDYRAVYLGWLMGIEGANDLADAEESLDDLEPPVPPGLAKLTPAQKSLVGYLEISDDLLAVAAEASATAKPIATPKPKELAAWIADLPAAMKDGWLLAAATGDEPNLHLRLMSEFRRFRKAEITGSASPVKRRTIGEILARVEEVETAREEKAAAIAKAEAERKAADLAAEKAVFNAALAGTKSPLAKHGTTFAEIWTAAERIIKPANAVAYSATVEVIAELKSAMARAGKGSDFAADLARFRTKHQRKSKLLSLLDQAGLR